MRTDGSGDMARVTRRRPGAGPVAHGAGGPRLRRRRLAGREAAQVCPWASQLLVAIVLARAPLGAGGAGRARQGGSSTLPSGRYPWPVRYWRVRCSSPRWPGWRCRSGGWACSPRRRRSHRRDGAGHPGHRPAGRWPGAADPVVTGARQGRTRRPRRAGYQAARGAARATARVGKKGSRRHAQDQGNQSRRRDSTATR